MVGISVYNISSTSARVSWPSASGCLDTFYSVMYDPNWSNLLMFYKRRSFMHEERIPTSQTATRLSMLAPHTTYFLCVTCQAANPAREQCQVFSTLSDNSDQAGGVGWELALWLASSLMLLLIACVLLWSCLYNVCPSRTGGLSGPGCPLDSHHAGNTRSDCLYTPSSSSSSSDSVTQKPLHLTQAAGHGITQGQMLRSTAKPPDSVSNG